MIASLPMYDWPELKADTDAFWDLLAAELQKAGFDAPERLNRSDCENAHWLNQELLFSQTCGYPFATELSSHVQLLGTPHYAVEGCDGPYYSSAVIVSKEADYADLVETKSARFVFNSTNSLSGFRCLGPMTGPPLKWFFSACESGSHRASALQVAKREADIAAIDAVCWHLFQKFEPQAARKLRVLTWTPKLPALPYITSNVFSASQVETMRRCLSETVNLSGNRSLSQSLRLQEISSICRETYVTLGKL